MPLGRSLRWRGSEERVQDLAANPPQVEGDAMPVAPQDIHDLLKALTDALQPKNDWIELVKAAFWPAIAAFGLFILRKPLSQFLMGLGDRITGFSLSVGAVSIQF